MPPQLYRIVGSIFALYQMAGAQTPTGDLVKQLLDRIDRLEKRVAELETGKAAPPASTPAAASAAAAPGHMQHDTLVIPPDADFSRPSLNLSGFSDINFVASDQKGTNSGFNEGQFILHVSSALSRKVSFFGEIGFTARRDAGLGTPQAAGFNPEVERTIIRYDYNDQFKLSFGRYHTPINYWNTAFHHGSWLQTTASRPEMAQFGGSFIPVHFVGALAEGSAPAGGLNLNYNFGVGNGRGSVINRDGDAGDVNNNRAWLMNAFVKPDKIFGFQMGGSVYRDRITAVGLPPTGEWIQSFHIVREKENPELIAEFANIRHKTDRGVVSNSQAWYVQLAYRVDPRFKPYYRYEYIHIPQSATILRQVPGLNGSTVGVRYDLTTFSALKFEFRRFKRPGLPAANIGYLQSSFTF